MSVMRLCCNGFGSRLSFLLLRAIQGQLTPTIRHGVASGGVKTFGNYSKMLTEILTERMGSDVTD